LYKYQRENFPETPIGFMNPDKTYGHLFTSDDIQKKYADTYIRKALRENRDKKFIFIPYHQGLVIEFFNFKEIYYRI
jgi:hypothetical protein